MLIRIEYITTNFAGNTVNILVHTGEHIITGVVAALIYLNVFSAAANTICVFIGLAALTQMHPISQISADVTIDMALLVTAICKGQVIFMKAYQLLSAIVAPGIMPAVTRIIHINIDVPESPNIHLLVGTAAVAAVHLLFVIAAVVMCAAVQFAAIVAGVPALILVIFNMIVMPDDGDHDAVSLNTLAASDTGALVGITVNHMPPIVCFFAAGTAVIAVFSVKVNKISIVHNFIDKYVLSTTVLAMVGIRAVEHMIPRVHFIATDTAIHLVLILIIISIIHIVFGMVGSVGKRHIFSTAGGAFILAADSIMEFLPIKFAA